MKTIARDWFGDDYEFRQLCGDAVSQATDEKSQEFANTMVRNAKRYGLETYISEAQLKWLCKLADHDMPQRRVP